jgi:hypothetical protein
VFRKQGRDLSRHKQGRDLLHRTREQGLSLRKRERDLAFRKPLIKFRWLSFFRTSLYIINSMIDNFIISQKMLTVNKITFLLLSYKKVTKLIFFCLVGKIFR